MANTLHQTPVAQECVGVMVYHCVTRAVELARQQFFSQRHAYRIGNSLA